MSASSNFILFQTQPKKNLYIVRHFLPLRDAPNWRILSFGMRRTMVGVSWVVPRGPLEVVEVGKRQQWRLFRATRGPRVIAGNDGGGFKQPAGESPVASKDPSEVEVGVEGSGGDQKMAAIWKFAAFVFFYVKIFGSGIIIPAVVVWLGYENFWMLICKVVNATDFFSQFGLILDFKEGERKRVHIDSVTYDGIVERKGNLEDYDGNIISLKTEDLIHKPIVKLGNNANGIWMDIVDCEGWHLQQVLDLCTRARLVLAQHPSTLDVETRIEPSPKNDFQVRITCRMQAEDVQTFLKVKEHLWTRLLKIKEM